MRPVASWQVPASDGASVPRSRKSPLTTHEDRKITGDSRMRSPNAPGLLPTHCSRFSEAGSGLEDKFLVFGFSSAWSLQEFTAASDKEVIVGNGLKNGAARGFVLMPQAVQP